MEAHGTWNLQPVVLTLNSLCTFALNLSVFLVISHTSALTIRVAGVVKDWVVVLLSALLFADTKLTVINLFGYGIGKYLKVHSLYIFISCNKHLSIISFRGHSQGLTINLHYGGQGCGSIIQIILKK